MTPSSFLVDLRSPLVLDTSVLVNLNASQIGKTILTILPNSIVVPRIVEEEIRRTVHREHSGSAFLQHLCEANVIEIVDLDDAEWGYFEQLTSGPRSLDDGEAAAISVAAARSSIPVIDERKGRSRARSFIPVMEPAWSLDLLWHAHVVAELGHKAAIHAVYLALRDGRMRIPKERADEVVLLLGEKRARDCASLPDYRARFNRETK